MITPKRINELAGDVLALLSDACEGDERPAFVLIFALPSNYKEIRYTANVSREDGIRLLRETAVSMKASEN